MRVFKLYASLVGAYVHSYGAHSFCAGALGCDVLRKQMLGEVARLAVGGSGATFVDDVEIGVAALCPPPHVRRGEVEDLSDVACAVAVGKEHGHRQQVAVVGRCKLLEHGIASFLVLPCGSVGDDVP